MQDSQLRLRRLNGRQQQVSKVIRRFVEVEAESLAPEALGDNVELDAMGVARDFSLCSR